MKNSEDYKKDISEIRSMMERSSRFISLSGLSGVLVGIYALIASYFAYRIVYIDTSIFQYRKTYLMEIDTLRSLIFIAGITLLLSIITGIILTTRKAKKDGLSIWEEGSRKLLINLFIPLFTGGLFIVALAMRGYFGIIAPVSLLFYGLSLINASKYTLTDVRYLGLTEILLGLVSSFYPGYGLVFWATGFGLLHIIYGISMYIKYEK